MKKTPIILLITLITTLITACGSTKETSSNVDVNITALKGPTAMGLVSFMSQADTGELTDNNYNFEILASIDEVTPKLLQGETDIAAIPANVASVLYNNTEGEVRVLAINTLGVLYIVESGDATITSVRDLQGKTIYASGKGATPEYALNYILKENGIDPDTDVNIEWKSEHSECLSALLAEDNAIAMLPQPFVTTAQTKSDNINVVLDLTKEWDKLQEGSENPSALLTGVVVARTEFIEQNPKAVSDFLDHYKESVDYVTTNTDKAAALIGEYDIVTEEIAKKALPYCNITLIDGEDLKEKLSGYLNVLYEQNPKSIGGTLPADDFYYIQ
jgi:NitT/TauT family transport system substrate-binding protein